MIRKKTTFALVIGLAVFSGGAPWARAEERQAEDAKSYQAAYALVMSEKWSEAAKALEAFLAAYAKSGWVDDARYWQAYVAEKTGRSYEEAFKTYEKFLKEYPKSQWINQARSSMIRLGRALAKSGKPEYEAAIKAF